MGFKTFAAGAILTAADVNDYLMEQAVISCTSATRPGTPQEGMTIYETDTDLMLVYNGSAWKTLLYTANVAFTPALTATTTSPTLGTGSVTSGEYSRHGGWLDAQGIIKFGTSGTAAGSGTYLITLPGGFSQAAFTDGTTPLGRVRISDFSASQAATGHLLYYDATHLYMEMQGAALSALAPVTHASPMAWSTEDKIDFSFRVRLA